MVERDGDNDQMSFAVVKAAKEEEPEVVPA